MQKSHEPFISLLYPSAESREFHADPANLPNISDAVCRELGLTEILPLRTSVLSHWFTADEEVIRYRQSTMKDLMEIPELSRALLSVRPVLDDIHELRILEGAGGENDYLYSITEIELYVSCIEMLHEGIAPVKDRLTSVSFISLASFLEELVESDYYRELNKKLSELTARVHEIKSVTVGVNLDAQLRPTTAGILSINAESFKSGRTLDKILRLSFRNDAFTSIAPLAPIVKGQSENKREALIGAFNGAIEDVYHSSVKGWRQIVTDYVLDNADFLLRLTPEIEFVCRALELLGKLEAHAGCSLCFPTVCEKSEKAFSAKGLYNPRVALMIDEEIVSNDLAFDENAGIYILTGPNRGGKSVITVAVGAAEAMLQLGLPVPAREASLSVADGIFTHFPEGADDTIDKGRLGEECARLRDIFGEATEYSMILFDESLSSTGAYEASYIAEELLVAASARRCRGIFSTHLHELAGRLSEINARCLSYGGVLLDTLVAGIEEGRRSFKIVRQKPDGKSYARDIANKYGLSLEDLIGRASMDVGGTV